MHAAKAGQEEHPSQRTAQGERTGKIRPEISQKLGGQAILAAAAAGREPGEGMAFGTAAHCISSVCARFHRMQVFISAGLGHRANALCETYTSACS